MFSINGVEAFLAVLWLTGLACALADFTRGHRGASGVLVIAAAVVVPIVGSLLAFTAFLMHSRVIAKVGGGGDPS